MAFSPSEFWHNADKKLGFAKSNRFIVTIPLPAAIGISSGITRSLELQCENAELPGKSLAMAEVKVYGPSYKMATHKQYTNEITLTFLCTNKGFERQLFDDWIEYITPDQTNNLRFPGGIDGFSGTYWTNMIITQYNEYDQLNLLYQQSQNTPKIYYIEPEGTDITIPESFSDAKESPPTAINQVELYQCFPSGYAAQPLNWGDDAIQKLSVQFSYRTYKNLL